MKMWIYAIPIMTIAVVSLGCSDIQATEGDWEASLLDNSEPWNGSDMNWLLNELDLDVFRFKADIPESRTINIVWELYQDGTLVKRNDGAHLSLSSGPARGRIVLKRDGDALGVNFSINGTGTGTTLPSLKTLSGPQMIDLPGTISDGTAPQPFFALVQVSEGKQLDSENMYSPELHDQAIYLYVVRE